MKIEKQRNNLRPQEGKEGKQVSVNTRSRLTVKRGIKSGLYWEGSLELSQWWIIVKWIRSLGLRT